MILPNLVCNIFEVFYFAYLGMAGCADDVAAWLDKLGLNEYTEKFLAAGYSSLQQCITLSKADLLAIGIGKVGHVNRLFRDLEKMKTDGELEMSPSPPSSLPASPLPDLPPPVVKSVVPPAVPLRRTLLHKPKSDGSIINSPPPPKLMPRKGSLRKSMSAHVIQPLNNMHTVEGQVNPGKIPNSQSLGDVVSSSELKNEITRIRPPIAPS